MDFVQTSKFASANRPLIALTDPPRLMREWEVSIPQVARDAWFLVPQGTTTDGASIPRFLWRICGHPLEVPRVYAATFHDWLYGQGGTRAQRKRADRCYHALLRHFGIGAVRAAIEYYALRLCGWSHWQNKKG